jgi:hypothetical protein
MLTLAPKRGFAPETGSCRQPESISLNLDGGEFRDGDTLPSSSVSSWDWRSIQQAGFRPDTRLQIDRVHSVPTWD